jgi:hypothetical protein
MASRLPDGILRAQRVIAMATRPRHEVDHVIDAGERDQRPHVSGMPGLPARFAAALLTPAPLSLPPGKTIRGRRLRGHRRILLAQRELASQVRDLFRLLSQLFSQLGEFLVPFRKCAP